MKKTLVNMVSLLLLCSGGCAKKLELRSNTAKREDSKAKSEDSEAKTKTKSEDSKAKSEDSNEDPATSYVKAAAAGDINRMKDLEAKKDDAGSPIIDPKAKKTALIEASKANKLNAVRHIVPSEIVKLTLSLADLEYVLGELERKSIKNQCYHHILKCTYFKLAAAGDLTEMQALEAKKDTAGSPIIDPKAKKTALIEASKADKLNVVRHIVPDKLVELTLSLADLEYVLDELEKKSIDNRCYLGIYRYVYLHTSDGTKKELMCKKKDKTGKKIINWAWYPDALYRNYFITNIWD